MRAILQGSAGGTGRRAWLILALVPLLGAGRARAETVTHTAPDFTLEVPPGYRQLPPGRDMLYLFGTSDPAEGVPDAVVSVQRLHGTIGPEPPPTPPGARLTRAKWKGHDVYVAGTRVRHLFSVAASRAVQVPLWGEAVQINVAVPGAKEDTADGILADFLAGLDGPSNLATDEEARSFRTRRITTAVVAPVALGAAALLAVWLRRRRTARAARRPRAPARETPAVRHARALKAAAATAVGAFLLLWVGFVLSIYLGYGAPADVEPERRGEQMVWGSFKLSLTCALVAYGLSRLRSQFRAPATSPGEPRAGQGSASTFAGDDAAQNLFHITDDREGA